jgi:hypothetical protein
MAAAILLNSFSLLDIPDFCPITGAVCHNYGAWLVKTTGKCQSLQVSITGNYKGLVETTKDYRRVVKITLTNSRFPKICHFNS